MRAATGFSRRVSFAAIAAVGVSTAAFAEPVTKPADGVADRPHVTSPYWNNNNNLDRAASTSDLVLQTVEAVPPARAAAVASRWEFFQAENNLLRTNHVLSLNFEESESYRASTEAVHAAWDAYETARDRALEPLRSTDEYKAAHDLGDSVSQQIAEESAKEKPDPQQLQNLAALKMNYLHAATALEGKILADDENVRSARKHLLDTTRRFSQLKADFSRDIRESIELADLRRVRDAAQVRRLASDAYYWGTVNARDIALDFAYFSRRIDRLTSASGYGYGNAGGYGPDYYGYPRIATYYPNSSLP